MGVPWTVGVTWARGLVLAAVAVHGCDATGGDPGGSTGSSTGSEGTSTSVGTSEASTSSGAAAESTGVFRECTPVDPDARGLAELKACADTECTEFDEVLWFALGDSGVALDETFELACQVAGTEPVNNSQQRWRLSGCTGERAPESGTAMVVASGDTSLPLQEGEDVRVTVHRSHGVFQYDDHLSWTIRDDTDELRVLRSSGFYLPPQGMAEPLMLESALQDCAMEQYCGAVQTWMDVTVRHEGASAIIPHGHRARIGTEARFEVLVNRADYLEGSSCGLYSGWEWYELLVAGAS